MNQRWRHGHSSFVMRMRERGTSFAAGIKFEGLWRLAIACLFTVGLGGGALAKDIQPAMQTNWVYFSWNLYPSFGCHDTDQEYIDTRINWLQSRSQYGCAVYQTSSPVWPTNSSGNTSGGPQCTPPGDVTWSYSYQHQEHTTWTFKQDGYAGLPEPHCMPATSDQSEDIGRKYWFTCSLDYDLTNTANPYCRRKTTAPLPAKSLGNCCEGGDGVPRDGNPITLNIGNKYQEETDYVATGPFPLKVTRHYNSLAAASSFSFGPSWSFTYDRRLVIRDASILVKSVNAVREDGRVIFFDNSTGSWVAYKDNVETLSEVSGPGMAAWKLVDTQDNVELYDDAGALLSITNRAGVTLMLNYESGGRLESISDPFGRQLTIGYDSLNRIGSITLPGGGQLVYTYGTGGNLSSVTYPDSSTRSFLYNEAAYTDGVNFPNALTGIVDESGARFATFHYDASGRATHSEHAGGANALSVVYNLDGTVTTTDAAGGSRTYTLGLSLQVKRTTSVSGSPCIQCAERVKSYTYDANGNATYKTDFGGIVTKYSYDLTRNLETSRWEAYGSTVSRRIDTLWHATYRLPTQVSGTARRYDYTYDSMGNLLTRTITDTSVTPNVARTWTYSYDGYGRVLTEDGPRTDVNDVTTYSYYTCSSGYECGQVHTITNALNQTTTYDAYDADGQPLTITDSNGVVTTLTYDARQRLQSRQVAGETASYSYWPTGLLKRATQADGSYVEYTYDSAQRLVSVSDALGNHIDYTLDAMGNRTAENVYDPSSVLKRTHTRVYNTLNQLYQDVNAANTAAVTTTYTLNNNGLVTGVSAPLGRNTVNTYDALGRLKQTTDAAGGGTVLAYDANDNLTSVKDPRNLINTFGYNGFGDVKTQAIVGTGTTTNTYDSGGNLATSTDARSASANYTYDPLNRVTSIDYRKSGASDQTIAISYDMGANGVGRLTSAGDATQSMAWSYDTLGRVISKTQTVGTLNLVVGYAYADGHVVSISLPSGNVLTYTYDNAGRPWTMVLNGSTTIASNVTYDPFGPVTGWTWGNGSATTRSYDLDGQVLQRVGAGTTYGYSYDDAARITGISDSGNGANSWTYGYDALDRLTTATAGIGPYGFTYDASGNRLSQTGSSATTFTIASTSNRLTATSGALVRTYGYDTAGNVTSYGGMTFAYNNRGRLKSFTVGGTTSNYVYNVLGQRVKRDDAGANATTYAYDEVGHILGEYDSTGALIEEIVWLGDIPIASIRHNEGNSGYGVFYIHADHLGAPAQLTRATDNAIVWSWDHGPFGDSAPAEDPDGNGLFVNFNLRFPGQLYESRTGLNYNYRRDYDPQVGRYVESDPIGLKAGPNTYAYADDSPIDVADPTGLLSCTYHTATGRLFCYNNAGSEIVLTAGMAKAGQGMCQDKSYCEMIKNEGPLPRGNYFIKPPGYVSKHPKWLFLKPSALNYMNGRGEFFIHPWGISNGCISIYMNSDFKTISDWATTDNGGDLSVVP